MGQVHTFVNYQGFETDPATMPLILGGVLQGARKTPALRMHEARFYTGALTDAQMLAAYQSLQTKWGIAEPLGESWRWTSLALGSVAPSPVPVVAPATVTAWTASLVPANITGPTPTLTAAPGATLEWFAPIYGVDNVATYSRPSVRLAPGALLGLLDGLGGDLLQRAVLVVYLPSGPTARVLTGTPSVLHLDGDALIAGGGTADLTVPANTITTESHVGCARLLVFQLATDGTLQWLTNGGYVNVTEFMTDLFWYETTLPPPATNGDGGVVMGTYLGVDGAMDLFELAVFTGPLDEEGMRRVAYERQMEWLMHATNVF